MEVILFISDTHFGASDMSGARLLDRWRSFHDRVVALIGEYSPGRVHIVLGGDLVEGENIYPRQAWDQAGGLDEQFLDAAGYLTMLITSVASMAPTRVYSVEGNHGRVSKHSYGNIDTLVALHVRSMTVDLVEEFRVATRRRPLFFEAGGLRWLAWHGDGIRMYMNIPFYGIWRRVMAWSQEHRFDGVLLGHFHSANYYHAGGKHVFLNGAWHISPEYSFEKGLTQSPYQWLVAVENGRLEDLRLLPTL